MHAGWTSAPRPGWGKSHQERASAANKAIGQYAQTARTSTENALGPWSGPSCVREPDPMTVWIRVMEAATRLGVTHQTVRNWLAKLKLKGTKLGGFQLVDAASVEKAGRSAPVPPAEALAAATGSRGRKHCDADRLVGTRGGGPTPRRKTHRVEADRLLSGDRRE